MAFEYLGPAHKDTHLDIDILDIYENAESMYLTVESKYYTVVRCNQTFCNITGLKKSETLGTSVLVFFPVSNRNQIDQSCRALLSRSKVPQQSIQLQCSDGSSLEALINYELIKNQNGGPQLLRLSLKNAVTKATPSNYELDSEQRFRIMADCAPVLLWMSGTNSDCNFFNQTWLAFTGRTMEQELGIGWAEGVYHEDLQMVVDTYMAAFYTRQELQMEYRLRRADGEYRWVLDKGTPRYHPDGSFAGFIGSCVDITDRKQSEAGLVELADQLSRSNRELQNYIHVASHDLQEPVRTIINFSELLSKEKDIAVNGSEYLAFVVEGAKRLKLLIDGLLSYSNLNQRLKQLRRVDLNVLVRHVLKDLEHSVNEQGAQITVGDLPSVKADAVQLQQLFLNLFGNALKFRKESEQPTVHLTAIREGNDWVFQVKDNGIGIPAEHHKRIFEMFRRLHSQDKYKGSGIGLAVCQRVVESLGGKIWIESEERKGTTFFFSIPADQDETT